MNSGSVAEDFEKGPPPERKMWVESESYSTQMHAHQEKKCVGSDR